MYNKKQNFFALIFNILAVFVKVRNTKSTASSINFIIYLLWLSDVRLFIFDIVAKLTYNIPLIDILLEKHFNANPPSKGLKAYEQSNRSQFKTLYTSVQSIHLPLDITSTYVIM